MNLSVISEKDVQVEESASGIIFLFMGVSRITGKMATVFDEGGRPLINQKNRNQVRHMNALVDEQLLLPFRTRSFLEFRGWLHYTYYTTSTLHQSVEVTLQDVDIRRR
jgi:hypothetical protein